MAKKRKVTTREFVHTCKDKAGGDIVKSNMGNWKRRSRPKSGGNPTGKVKCKACSVEHNARVA